MKKHMEKVETPGVELQKIEEVQVIEIQPKLVRNLDQTLNVLDKLWQKQKQRTVLNHTIDSLSAFELTKSENEMEENTNYYTGCELVIKDDERRSFTTKNPVLIKGVVEFLKTRCAERLMEVEAEIVLPA